MPFGISLGGEKSKESSKGITTKGTTRFGTKGGTESINQVTALLEEFDREAKGAITRGTEFSRGALESAIPQLAALFDSFSPEAADLSSKESVTAAIDEILNKGLPGVRSAATVSGGFNNTSIQLLQNDVLARAAAAGAGVREATRARFEENRSALVGNFLDVLSQIQESEAVSIDTETGTQTGTEQETGFREFAEEAGESIDETIIERGSGKSSGISFGVSASSGGEK